MSVTGKRMRKNPHGWMLAAVLLLAAAGLLAVHSHQTAAVPPEEPAQEEPPVMVIPAEPASARETFFPFSPFQFSSSVAEATVSPVTQKYVPRFNPL